jgi:hypothetical protein
MSVFATALAAAQSIVRDVAGEAVTYTRGGSYVTIAAAVPAATRVDMAGDDGSAVTATIRDYLVAAAALVLGGATVEPEPGDRVTAADGTVYEVVRLADGRCWRPSGTAGTTLRIHTQLIETGA